ncbi:MAG: PQQ-binding-like beta-propeller repeat protein [Zavarzinella sp.]
MKYGLWIALWSLCATHVSAEDWSQWLGNHRDGVYREKELLQVFPKEGPKVSWKIPCGMGYSGPSVAHGKVFFTDRQLAQKAANPANPFAVSGIQGNERIRCLEETTGKVLWEHEYPCEYRISYPAGPRATPTITEKHVFSLGAMGDFFCYEIKTGKILWEKHFLKDFNASLPFWGFSAHPLAYNDTVICLAGGAQGKTVVAFDAATGKEKWSALNVGDPGYATPIIIELQGKPQLIIWTPKAIYGLEPASGKKIWSFDWTINSSLTAVVPRFVENRYLFFSAFYNGSLLLDVSGDQPKVVWKSKSKNNGSSVMPNNTLDLHSIMCTPWIADGNIYGVCSYGELRCLDLLTGERKWFTHEPTSGKSLRWGHAFIIPTTEGFSYIFNEQGQLITCHFSPKEYKEISRATILKPTNKMATGRPVVWTHPAFANHHMIVRNDEEIIRISLQK